MLKIKKIEDFETLKGKVPKDWRPGVFQTIGFLKTFAKHFSDSQDIILFGFYEDEKLIGYGAFEKVGDKALFLGLKQVLNNQEVTDYGDIFIENHEDEVYLEVWRQILKFFQEESIKSLQLDNVRADSKTFEVFSSLPTANLKEQIVSPYIDLPETWEEYLSSLERTDRKELKRKLRRLDEAENLHFCTDETIKDDFEEFVRLVRLSSQEKESFMSGQMKSFFWDLVMADKGDWGAHFCFLRVGKRYVSSLMTFECGDSIWAYNSGYDPKYNFYSVGILLHACKIRQAIERGIKKYDFLRGSERYKYDLGAKDLKLYKIEVLTNSQRL